MLHSHGTKTPKSDCFLILISVTHIYNSERKSVSWINLSYYPRTFLNKLIVKRLSSLYYWKRASWSCLPSYHLYTNAGRMGQFGQRSDWLDDQGSTLGFLSRPYSPTYVDSFPIGTEDIHEMLRLWMCAALWPSCSMHIIEKLK
jgi:hypothetical protein